MARREFIGSTSYFWSPREGMVVKSLHPVFVEVYAQKIVVESKILERLGEHRRIIPYLGLRNELPRGICLAEASHGSLQTYLDAAQAVDEAMRNTICRQLLEAVEFIHRQGVIHSDLHPENCLLHQTKSGLDLLLCDFGGSACADLSLDGYGLPDPPFWNTEWDATTDTDIFAAGSIMYAVMKGFWPFKNEVGDLESVQDYQARVVESVKQGVFPETQTIAGGEVITACWTERHHTATELLVLLEGCLLPQLKSESLPV